jgi:16S rRNA (guanine527-N7)-methyltransferase
MFLTRTAHRLALSPSDDQIRRLLDLERLLRHRAVPLGMISRSDRDRLLPRHIVDCLRAAALLSSDDREILDLGSGSGLPGLVVAISRPDVHVGLVEPRRRRGAFLEFAAGELGLSNVAILPHSAEDIVARADAATARALAPLERSWALARPLLRPGGRLLYFSGPLRQAPSVPDGAASIEVAGRFPVDSPGPIVIITRE